jgi:putative hydrolase of the HAD superfamily
MSDTVQTRVPIQAVGFDVDGTLYPNFLMFVLSLPSVFAAPRLAWTFSRVRKAVRRVEVIDDFRRTQALLIAERLRADPDETQKRIEEKLYKNWERSFRFLFPLPHIAEAVAELRGLGLKLGVLSDFPLQNKLAYLGLEGLWDAALSSEDTGYLKPRKEPFLELARRLGVAPGAVLYVGNSYFHDVLGAQGAGMRSAYLSRRRFVPQTHRVDVPASVPDLVFADYRDLPAFVKSEEKKSRAYYHG